MKSSVHLAIWLMIFVSVAPLRAHDPGLSTAQGQLRSGGLELSTAYSTTDIRQLMEGIATVPSQWGPGEFEALQPALLRIAPSLWDVRSGERVVSAREVRVELLSGIDVRFHFYFATPTPTPEQPLILRAQSLARLPPGHREFISITGAGGSTWVEKLLSAQDSTVTLAPSSAGQTAKSEPASPGFWGFLKLGVEHIWTGYDHLLFLLGLLIVCRTFRSIVTIISCFTLAHSITLALATLNVITLSPRLVEPAIAASIVFVGLENLWRRGAEPRGRGALTFAFGLIHGFGFASVLRDLGVGSAGQGLALPLFSFNLGVEVGQVAVASLVLPIVWQLRKNERFKTRGVPLLSGAVVLAGAYWFIERTLFT